MKDSINRKHNEREVQWQPQATTVMALWLTEPGERKRSTCDKLNKRSSETVGRREVRFARSEIHAKSEAVLYHAALLVR